MILKYAINTFISDLIELQLVHDIISYHAKVILEGYIQ